MVSEEASYGGGGGVYRSNTMSQYDMGYATAGAGEWGYDIDKVLKQYKIRIGKSFMGFNQLLDYFDVSRLPDYDGAPMPYIGHIIFSRPSLNVDVYGRGCSPPDDQAIANYAALQSNSITSAWVNDAYGKKILNSLSAASDSCYLPVFTNRAMSYAVQDAQIKTIEKGHTFYGHFIKYGKHSEEHKIGGTISIDFRNDYYHSILKAIWIWCSYIAIVSKTGAVSPSMIYQQNGILDYAGSIYYIVTRADSTSIVYWEKLTGVFPKTIPLSMFSYNDNLWVEDKLTIEFDYAIRSDPCDPNVLFDLNVLSAPRVWQAEMYMSGGLTQQQRMNFNRFNRNTSLLTRPDSFEGPYGRGNAYASCPIIRAYRTLDDGLQYYLQWSRGGVVD
ncbi:MAG: hypothetical protein NC489_07955 [Ruminococcus flavefaciens]|nr:hypothetical protein [Ruminococcus flavefaciens]